MKNYKKWCSAGYISFHSSLLDNCLRLSRKQCGSSYVGEPPENRTLQGAVAPRAQRIACGLRNSLCRKLQIPKEFSASQARAPLPNRGFQAAVAHRACDLQLVFIAVLAMVASVLSSGQTSALELGASPPELVFEGKAGKFVCANLSVESNRALSVVFEERWLVRNYAGGWAEQPLLAGKALGLSVALPSSVELEIRREEKEERWRARVPVCVVGEQAGEYAGLLFIMPEEGIAGIGVRMRVQLEGGGKEEERAPGAVLRLTRAEETRREKDAEEGNGTAFLLAEEALGLLLMGEVLRRAAAQGKRTDTSYRKSL